MNDFRVPTPWGDASIHSLGDAIVAVNPPTDGRVTGTPLGSDAPAAVIELAGHMERYFAGDAVELVVRDTLASWLDAAGMEGFQRAASLALFDVPYGVTVTYGELAELAGYPGAARAAGSVCSRNPLPIVVPCHRVLPVGRRLGRYGTLGAHYKRRLLELEGVTMDADGRPLAFA